jgi:glutaredoxin-related protein
MIKIMKKLVSPIILIFIFVLIIKPVFARENPLAGEKLEVNFFYSETCPHCIAEQRFLDKIEKKYLDVKIVRHPVSQTHCREIMIDLCKEYNLEKYIGVVPLTFVGNEFFLGFDNENGIGRKIEDSIVRQLSSSAGPGGDKSKIHLPIIGDIDLSKYSLLTQAVILGFFDGFNICSLGALVLILGLVLILKSRPKIILFGGLFILTTAVVYGALIFLWYQLFYILGPMLKIMNVLVGFLGIAGAVYFFKQFLKSRKADLICDSQGNKIVNKHSLKIQEAFKQSGKIWGLIVGVLIFASVITIVEFPCSAVVPVLFAGIMAHAKLSILSYLLHLLVYLVFYMLDEIIVFLIAVFTMNIKIVSSKAMKWLNLVEAIVLLGLGIYYLTGIF